MVPTCWQAAQAVSAERGRLASRDLTIKPGAGVHPVLRFAADAQLGELRLPALLPFSGGNVTIEGLAFELDREGPEERVAAISAEDTELTIRSCLFRKTAVRIGRKRAALRIRVQKTSSSAATAPGGLRRHLPF